MAKKGGKKKGREGPAPLAGAGLVRFFEEETRGVKVRPELTIILAFVLIIIVIIARLTIR